MCSDIKRKEHTGADRQTALEETGRAETKSQDERLLSDFKLGTVKKRKQEIKKRIPYRNLQEWSPELETSRDVERNLYCIFLWWPGKPFTLLKSQQCGMGLDIAVGFPTRQYTLTV